MQISCERCGTTYALDERLIPAGGAPVQCTRCGHVFTAMPPGAPAPAPKADAHKTMIFGTGGNAPPPPSAPPRASTQMFGASAAVAPPAPERSPTTQVFGAPRAPSGLPGVQVPSPAVAPNAPKVTQMFGGVQVQVQGPSVSASALDRPGAQIFGAGAVPQVPGPTAAPAGPKVTQMFGAGQVPGASAPSADLSTTQIFGGAQVPGPPAPSADLSTTQIFGGVQVPGLTVPPAERSVTQVFGATTEPGLPAVDHPAAQAFGSAPAPSKGKSGPKPTQLFGVPPSSPAPVKERSGPKPSLEPVSPDAPTPVPHISTTQMFGAPPSSLLADAARARSPDEERQPAGIKLPKIAASTPAPLADERFADTVIRNRNQQPDPISTAATQMFGAPDEEDLERAWAHRGQGRPAPAPADATEPFVPAHRADTRASLLKTQPLEPLITPLDSPSFANPTPLDTPLVRAPTSPHAARTSRLDLPPEMPELIAEPRTVEASPMDEALRLQRQMRRRTQLAIGVVVAVLLVIVLGIAGRALMSRRTTVPPDAVARRESVHLLLRRDDGQSRERAVAELEGLLSSHPDYASAQADLVVAMALQLDDARVQTRLLSSEADDLNRRVARLTEEKVPGDWENRVNAMTERLGEIKRAVEPLLERSGALDARLDERFRRLQSLQATSPEEQLAMGRAQAVYYGVKGSEQAITMAERYRQLGGTDGWSNVALAELALNARVSPDTMSAARTSMDELSSRDSTFLRSYVLSARLSIAQRQNENAANGLEAVLALNPAHEIARQLLAAARPNEQ